MKILIDMNLSPEWKAAFDVAEIESVHWSTVGNPRAADIEIIEMIERAGFEAVERDTVYNRM